MRIIQTADLDPERHRSQFEELQIYNGLDCCVTFEVLQPILDQMDNMTSATYEFEKSLMGPVLEMNMTGVLVDEHRRQLVMKLYEADLANLEQSFAYITRGVFEQDFNWRSNADMMRMFYDIMGIKPVKKRNANGQYVPTIDRKALEQIDAYYDARPFVGHLLALRDIGKKLGVLRTDIDADGRMRTSYNIAGTTTGRFSSSMGDFGYGTNLQNIEDLLRSVFIARPGYKFAYIDLEQAESRAVGAICWNTFHKGTYLDACESGDLHTTVCKLAWTELPWTGELKRDKAIAEQPFYRQHSYRHMAKVLGHGTNYNGKPVTMSKHTNLDAAIIKVFQGNYFTAFPELPEWHAEVIQTILQRGYLVSLMGRRRDFLGRPGDSSTHREAIAFDPQSSVGDILNRGMLQVWRATKSDHKLLSQVQLLLQIHDAILVEYPEEIEDEVIPLLCKTIEVPVELNHGRRLIIPSDAQVGWNWGKASKPCPPGCDKKHLHITEETANPFGLKGFSGHDDRKRKLD